MSLSIIKNIVFIVQLQGHKEISTYKLLAKIEYGAFYSLQDNSDKKIISFTLEATHMLSAFSAFLYTKSSI